MPFTQEQVNAMPPEQKQALLQQVNAEIQRRQGQQTTGGRLMGAAGAGLRAGVQALPGILTGAETKQPTAQEQLAQIKIDEAIAKAKKAALEVQRDAETAAAKTQEAERRKGLVGGRPTAQPLRQAQPQPQAQPIQQPIQPQIQPLPQPAEQVGRFEEVPIGEISETGVPSAKIQETLLFQATGKAQEKRIEEASKAGVNFEKTVNLFTGIIAQRKGAEIEQGGLGLIPGLIGKFNVAIKNPEFARTASAYGQRAETAFALNSVLTGQNRVIRGIIHMILGSLPGDLDPDTVVAAKTAQSLRNAYMLTRAFKQSGLSAAVLDKMSQEELDSLDVQGMVNDITLSDAEKEYLEARIDAALATPPAKERTLLPVEFDSEEEAEDADLPIGTKITVGGRPAIVE